MQRRAIFLDRDGTINRDHGFVHRPADLEMLAGAVAGLRHLARLGFALFITTNQSGIARGYFNEGHMHQFHEALCRQLDAEGIAIAGIYYCPFHPTEGLGSYRRESPWRKPAAGMIRAAVAEHDLDVAGSFTIGDKESDILAGQAAGCRTILVRTGQAADAEHTWTARSDYVAADLLDAAHFIERVSASSPPTNCLAGADVSPAPLVEIHTRGN